MNNALSYPFSRLSHLFKRDNRTLSALMAKGASGTFILKIIHTGATFLTTVLLARVLGAKDYGIYAYAISWVTLLGIFTHLGLPGVISRNVAAYHQAGDWGRMRGLLRFSFSAVGIASILCLLGAMLASWFAYKDNEPMRTALWLAFLLLPLSAFLVPCGATLLGLHQVIRAQTPSLLIQPLVFIIFVTGAWCFVTNELSVNAVLVLYLLATSLALLSAYFLFKQTLPNPVRTVKPLFEIKSWLSSALPLILMGSMHLVNTNADILMLTTMRGPEEAGIYKAATRGAGLIFIVLGIINTPLSPIIARLYASGERKRLQRALTNSARVALLFGLLIATPLIFLGRWFLALFGPEFVSGDSALTVLSCGQLFNVAAGSVGVILVMTGNESKAASGLALSAVLNVVLNALLIPIWGIEGAAAATAISTVMWNLLLIWHVWYVLKLDSTFLGLC